MAVVKRCTRFDHPTDIEARCAATGMRMTEQRRVIARVLAEATDHPDVEELYRRCVAIDDKISISTVYRTVKLFEDAGIIERHDFREGRARYEQMRGQSPRPSDQPARRQGDRVHLRGDRAAADRSRAQARLQAGRPPAGALLRAARRREELSDSRGIRTMVIAAFVACDCGRRSALYRRSVRRAEFEPCALIGASPPRHDQVLMTPPRKLHIKSYGCQMNVYDAQRMVDTLAPEGFVETATPMTPTSSSSTPATSARRRRRRSFPSSAGCA